MIVTLLTDFGTADSYVASMKGVILSRDPRIRLVDITHEVPAHDVETAAFLLACCYAEFPAGTVHLVVVDPGVGSSRRPIAVRAGEHRFVGPDNGVFDHVLRREPGFEARQIDFGPLPPASTTFHGRDVFAPVAADLAAGHPFEKVGPPVDGLTQLRFRGNRALPDNSLEGEILHVDRFGNCVTSLRREDTGDRWPAAIRLGEKVITGYSLHYAGGSSSEPFMIWGSAGYLEISINQGSAADRLKVGRGEPLVAVLAQG